MIFLQLIFTLFCSEITIPMWNYNSYNTVSFSDNFKFWCIDSTDDWLLNWEKLLYFRANAFKCIWIFVVLDIFRFIKVQRGCSAQIKQFTGLWLSIYFNSKILLVEFDFDTFCTATCLKSNNLTFDIVLSTNLIYIHMLGFIYEFFQSQPLGSRIFGRQRLLVLFWLFHINPIC